MKTLFHSMRFLLLDLAATLLFLALFSVTHNIGVSVAAGLVLALGQIGWQLARGKSVEALQWIGVVVILAAGAATLVTNNPVFVMAKLSLIYCLVGAAMLKRGWMNKYLPPIALETVPDLANAFGYVWAGLMFFSAVLNLVVALNASVLAWGAFMAGYSMASKTVLFMVQYGVMKTVGRRRYRAQMAIAA